MEEFNCKKGDKKVANFDRLVGFRAVGSGRSVHVYFVHFGALRSRNG